MENTLCRGDGHAIFIGLHLLDWTLLQNGGYLQLAQSNAPC
ncbi:MAG: hypothetical protein R2911_38630 [Caldilineaceae bacterium]